MHKKVLRLGFIQTKLREAFKTEIFKYAIYVPIYIILYIGKYIYIQSLAAISACSTKYTW